MSSCRAANAKACRAAGVDSAELATTAGWPLSLCERVLSAASPIPSPIMGEANHIARPLVAGGFDDLGLGGHGPRVAQVFVSEEKNHWR